MSESEKKEIQVTVKSLLDQQNVKQRFIDVLKERANGFTANLAVMINNSGTLKKCEPMSVITSAIIAASLDLPLDPNLGFSALVPFGNNATFQIMTKGFIQLAMRSGQYRTIGVTEIYEGQLISENPLTGEYVFDFTAKTSEKIIGYAAYFSLLNGFEKIVYWDIDKISKHGKKFSQTFKKGFGLWKDDFDSMAKKTVLKNLISKWGILSIEMQKAIIFDQSKPSDITDDAQPIYIDNSIDIDKINFEKERQRIIEYLSSCNTIDEIEILEGSIGNLEEYNVSDEFEAKKNTFNNSGKGKEKK